MASTPGPGLTLIDNKDITLGKVLGQGGFGAVYLARHVNWGKVAVKQLTGVSLTADIQKEADRMLRVLSSPYLVTVMGLMKNPRGVGIVMEYFKNGSLKEFEKKYMKCDCWARKIKMVEDIAFGMNYLHTLKPPIIHRDLKLENVFVGSAFDAKIGDLGLAVSSKSSLRKAHVSGTRSHIPPEASNPKATEPDEFWDIYTFAITTYEITSGCDAWRSRKNVIANDALIGLWVLQGHRPDLKVIHPEAPSELVDIIKKCWVAEPKQRPSFKDVVKSVTELFEARYNERGLRKADRAILEQMDLVEVSGSRRAGGSGATDSGMGSDAWASLEALSIKDNTKTATPMGKKKIQDTVASSESDSGLVAQIQGGSTLTGVYDQGKVMAAAASPDMTWRYKHTVDPAAGDVRACRMVSDSHLAVCLEGCVKVYQVGEDTSKLVYTLQSDEWGGRDIYGVAISKSLADDMLVICDGIPYIYIMPCRESRKHNHKYKIGSESKSPWCIAANASVAVIGMYLVKSYIVCKLSDLTHQFHVQLDFIPWDITMSAEYIWW
ncbi:probable serine/threonine-protein kinase DDB_G0282963 [Amphiura filiformis]|uniref:probable serine/threonine-protein kinase DDB_G0282963 n=1 Tax=Amphiura filiformis TaxID=82378 RepID=UPI003B21B89C